MQDPPCQTTIEDTELARGISRDPRLRAEPSQLPPHPLSGASGRPHLTVSGLEGRRGRGCPATAVGLSLPPLLGGRRIASSCPWGRETLLGTSPSVPRASCSAGLAILEHDWDHAEKPSSQGYAPRQLHLGPHITTYHLCNPRALLSCSVLPGGREKEVASHLRPHRAAAGSRRQ